MLLRPILRHALTLFLFFIFNLLSVAVPAYLSNIPSCLSHRIGAELRACMDFFDSKGEGSQIDYNAFARLCRFKEPEGLPQVQRLVNGTMYFL